jgi:hypothetical protein
VQSAHPGQVAQLVERSPEKAGVGGSIPSLATIIPKDLNKFADFISLNIFIEVRSVRKELVRTKSQARW